MCGITLGANLAMKHLSLVIVPIASLCLASQCLFVACQKDKITSTELTQASLTPNELTITAPSAGEASSRGALTLTHLSGAELVVIDARLVEYGSVKELALIDGDDWSETTLADGAARNIEILWTPRDAQPDRASLILTTNIGELSAQITTADLDALIQVEASGEWVDAESSAGGGRVSINGTAPGSRGDAFFKILSLGLEPLSISKICLSQTGESCLTPNELESADLPFTLCSSLLNNGCTPIELPEPINAGQSYDFALRYLAPERSVESSGVQLMIYSNAVGSPQVVYQVTAAPCVLGVNAEMCNIQLCGDGVIQGDEECDDGNQEPEDSCLPTCVLNQCGDGVRDRANEECDDGNDNNNDACRDDCTAARCGDGYLWEGVEICDDGDEDNGDRCLNDCTLAMCGDGFVWAGVEDCDDGNQSDDDECSSDCTSTRCGDGVLQSSREECDAGPRNGEGCLYGQVECEVCSETCEASAARGEYCGDGMINGPETCDLGDAERGECPYGEGDCMLCNELCQLTESAGTYCGDGLINGPEECDGQLGCEVTCVLSEDAPPCAPFCPELTWRSLSALDFTMGAEGYEPQEAPTHPASVAAFQMTESEVTIGQYRACVNEGTCEAPRNRNDNARCNWGGVNREQHPVNCITWSQARTFAQWVGGELPSEAQWERAARGAGGVGLLPWAMSAQPIVATCEDAVIGGVDGECDTMGTEPVCQHPNSHSAEGLCDLIGNVWEWTLDVYAPYDALARDDAPRCPDPLCAGALGVRVVRGGGWNNYAAGWRATTREGYAAESALNFFGFRVVKATVVGE